MNQHLPDDRDATPIDVLIDRSSLGAPSAKRLRAQSKVWASTGTKSRGRTRRPRNGTCESCGASTVSGVCRLCT